MIINLEKINIPQRIVEELDIIFSSFNEIEKVVLFGSRSRKDNKENLDIDLAIYGVKNNKWKLNEMINDIATLYSFDIVYVPSNISKAILFQIKKDGCIIYER